MERSTCALDAPERVHGSVNREMMIRILLLLSLTLIDCTLAEERTPTFQAEEDDNITFTLDSRIQTDIALTIVCVFHSEVIKILYEMIRGVEESQHEQFAGRVQMDRKALGGGEVRLHLSRVKVKDSGNYSCELAANYNEILRRWELQTSEYFVLKVAQKSEVTPKATTTGLTAAEVDHGEPLPANSGEGKAKEDLKILPQLSVLAIFIILMAAGSLGRRPKKNSDPAYKLQPLAETDHEEELFEEQPHPETAPDVDGHLSV